MSVTLFFRMYVVLSCFLFCNWLLLARLTDHRFFPHPSGYSLLRPTIECNVSISISSTLGEVEAIKSYSLDGSFHADHHINKHKQSRPTESKSSFIPYLDNKHVVGDKPWRIWFHGSHRVVLPEQNIAYNISPVYSCASRDGLSSALHVQH